MPFQIVIEVVDDGRLTVKSAAPPHIALKILREAADLIHGQVIVGTVLTVLDQQRRVVLAPASTNIARLGNGQGAPI